MSEDNKGQRVTLTGRLGKAPQLRFTAEGQAVSDFRLAVDKGHFDKEHDKWIKDGTDWYEVTAWDDLAEHAVDSLEKGDRVSVTGKVGEKVTEGKGIHEGSTFRDKTITASDIAVSLRFISVDVQRIARGTLSADAGISQ